MNPHPAIVKRAGKGSWRMIGLIVSLNPPLVCVVSLIRLTGFVCYFYIRYALCPLIRHSLINFLT